eukprot:TRINITY_DN2997_c0_g1_i2.p1 TRINITY_DN2997_c0_g1~~TRINITY_DN2997_c0_g1_i2.p1  ORF type:complete len:1980 (+),score=579.43 TRINITY_DN2997_c0_g1_i2:786-5942(+)
MADASPTSALVGNCHDGGGYLTIAGVNFNGAIPTVHTVKVSVNTEAAGTVTTPSTVFLPWSNDTSLPLPSFAVINSTSDRLVCEVDVYVGGPFWVSVQVGGVEGAAARVYLRHAAPETHNTTGECSANLTAGVWSQCESGAILTIAGAGFVPAPDHGYNSVSLSGIGTTYGRPLCWVKAATRHFISCLLDIPAGTEGVWAPVVTVGGKSSSWPHSGGLTLLSLQPSVTSVSGSQCSTAGGVLTCEGAAEGGGTPDSVLTIAGRLFSDSVPRLGVLLDGGEAGFGGRAPTCSVSAARVYSSASAYLTCLLVAPGGVSGQWAVRVRVGDAVSSGVSTAVVVRSPPPNNLTVALLDVLSHVEQAQTFTLRLRTHIGGYPADPTSGARANVSLHWHDSSPTRNGAVLENLQYGTSGTAEFDLAGHRTEEGVFDLPLFRVSLPGAYIVLVDVLQDSASVPTVRGRAALTVRSAPGTAPVVTSVTCGGGCLHGAVVTALGSGIDSTAAVSLAPPLGVACVNLDLVPPRMARCTLVVPVPMHAAVQLHVSTAGGRSEGSALTVYRGWGLPPVVTNTSAVMMRSGRRLSLSGMRFSPDIARNAITLSPATNTLAAGTGPAPRCQPTHVAASGTELHCRMTCSSTTDGWWSVSVRTEEGSAADAPDVMCTAPPIFAPVITAVGGCEAQPSGSGLQCSVAGARITVQGRHFDAALYGTAIELTPLADAGGPLPADCSVNTDVSSSEAVVCDTRADPQTRGGYALRVSTVAGATVSAASIVFVLDSAAAEQYEAPTGSLLSGCQSEVQLDSGAVLVGCDSGAELVFAAVRLDWRPGGNAVVFAAVSGEAADEADAAGLLSEAPDPAVPSCAITSVAYSVRSGSYQQLRCTLEVPWEGNGGTLYAVSLRNPARGTAALTRLVASRTPRPSLTGLSGSGGCSTLPSGVVWCAEGLVSDLLVLHGSNLPAPDVAAVRFEGGGGTAPSCTRLEGGSGNHPLVCTLSCDQTTSGEWGAVVEWNVGTVLLGSALTGRAQCHRQATGPLSVVAVGGCTGPSGWCLAGDTMLLRGAGFDTDSTSQRVSFASVSPWAAGPQPRCAPVAGGNTTHTGCVLSADGATGGDWLPALQRPSGDTATAPAPIRVYAEPSVPPTLTETSRYVRQGDVLTLFGAAFDAVASSNAVRFASTVRSRGKAPACTPSAAGPARLECVLSVEDGTTGGEWSVSVATLQGTSGAAAVYVGLPPTTAPSSAPSLPPSAAPSGSPTRFPLQPTASPDTQPPLAAESAEVTVTLAGNLADFDAASFQLSVSELLGVAAAAVAVVSAVEGSVVVVVAVRAPAPAAASALAAELASLINGGGPRVTELLPTALSASFVVTAAPTAATAAPTLPPSPPPTATQVLAAASDDAPLWERPELLVPVGVVLVGAAALLYRKRAKLAKLCRGRVRGRRHVRMRETPDVPRRPLSAPKRAPPPPDPDPDAGDLDPAASEPRRGDASPATEDEYEMPAEQQPAECIDAARMSLRQLHTELVRPTSASLKDRLAVNAEMWRRGVALCAEQEQSPCAEPPAELPAAEGRPSAPAAAPSPPAGCSSPPAAASPRSVVGELARLSDSAAGPSPHADSPPPPAAADADAAALCSTALAAAAVAKAVRFSYAPLGGPAARRTPRPRAAAAGPVRGHVAAGGAGAVAEQPDVAGVAAARHRRLPAARPGAVVRGGAEGQTGAGGGAGSRS